MRWIRKTADLRVQGHDHERQHDRHGRHGYGGCCGRCNACGWHASSREGRRRSAGQCERHGRRRSAAAGSCRADRRGPGDQLRRPEDHPAGEQPERLFRPRWPYGARRARCELLGGARRDTGPGGRVWLGQVRDGHVHHAPAGQADRPLRQGFEHRFRRHLGAGCRRQNPAQPARGAHQLHLPGADDLAQSVHAHRRAADGERAAAQPGLEPCRGTPPHSGAAGTRGHRRGAAAHEAVPARVFGAGSCSAS